MVAYQERKVSLVDVTFADFYVLCTPGKEELELAVPQPRPPRRARTITTLSKGHTFSVGFKLCTLAKEYFRWLRENDKTLSCRSPLS